ncbi:MAG: hypothetical protein FJX76_16210 [Armatimonadetes bacterium]|nr:hypothetical protein [Armatimonadota bacterium]
MCLHSIVVDPGRPERMWVAISSAGVFYTEDAGATWGARNKGIRAYFFPEDKFPEVGQCVHKLVSHPSRPDVLYAQNHAGNGQGGVYRSDNGGLEWRTIEEGLPAVFGFPIAVHPHQPDTIYVIPEKADSERVTPEGKPTVYRSREGGKTWEPKRQGLPDGAWLNVLRQAMCTDSASPAGVHFGTSTGQLFGSVDEGKTWRMLADCLPPIYSVRAVC